MTDDRFAELAGRVSGKNIKHWFTGSRPDWEHLSGIADALGVPFDTVRSVYYPFPTESPPDDWEQTCRRFSRQLSNQLRRVPLDARGGMQLAVAALLGGLSQELDRLTALDEQIATPADKAT